MRVKITPFELGGLKMKLNNAERIEALQAQLESVTPQDAMAEAGRKALLAEFVKMLQHETGSRTGDDIEDVHQMRVSIRRMRSTFSLLSPYYRRKVADSFTSQLRKVARALGEVRDLDVLMDDLMSLQSSLKGEKQAAIQGILAEVEQQRTAARNDLVKALDAKSYRRLVKDFSRFLTSAGKGAQSHDDNVTPYQVRHVLPVMISERLAVVRAYETVLDSADFETLHGLRIEFKRLRYAVALFQEVLGTQIDDFIDELKQIQDHLGRLNDIVVARDWFDSIADGLDEAQTAVIQDYADSLTAEEQDLLAQFPEVWERFNTRKVQTKLSNALLALK
jgi:CHAD domain-containing protein